MRRLAQGEVDRELGRAAEPGEVDAGVANQLVVAGPANQQIAALATVERVLAVAAVETVAAVIAVERVVAPHTADPVVERQARDGVGLGVPCQDVIARGGRGREGPLIELRRPNIRQARSRLRAGGADLVKGTGGQRIAGGEGGVERGIEQGNRAVAETMPPPVSGSIVANTNAPETLTRSPGMMSPTATPRMLRPLLVSSLAAKSLSDVLFGFKGYISDI